MKIFGFDFSNLSFSKEENIKHNRRVIKSLSRTVENGFSPDGFIENQNRLGCIKYAARDFAYCGCGCIAYWNILLSRGRKIGIPRLASEMEKGCVFGGVFGTNAFFMKRFMEKRGEKIEVSLSPEDILKSGAKEAIIMYYKKPRTAHYVAFTAAGTDENGKRLYRFYNVCGKLMRRFGEGNPVILSLEEFIAETGYNLSIYFKIS
ncbi:MAG: hypothetical protein IJE28_09705 [Oscillospiraceae bacterium]|nr:hypothetical protein [Oscillospiraceae bacterium]MBQ3501383.1 hypothetical protein [Oscillospiraceae bacterium]MBQ4546725.1 hypothetical protein [Oscillospiraceae bacterium]MBQ4643369.1 hypothetical protein [Oscillospiraceae bacterium]